MPLDTRRLPVPEESKSPHDIAKSSGKKPEIINAGGSRNDGRKPEELRPIFLRAGVVSQAKGSAYLEMNQTKVICAVYGPREVTRREDFSMQGQLYCEFKYATFSGKTRRSHQMDSEEKDISCILQQALCPAVQLEKFPKARMDVFVTVLQDDGSALSGAITCASVALAHAGLEMYDMVVGCTLRRFESLVILDPCGSEEFKSKVGEPSLNNGSITLGFMPSLHQVSALVERGEMDWQVAIEGIKILVEACQRTFPVVQQCLIKSLKSQSETVNET